jgi:hypothetical protein
MSAAGKVEERTLFRHRARLFTMNTSGQWVELGTGDAKVSEGAEIASVQAHALKPFV